MSEQSGRSVAITGAGGGLGRDIALQFAAKGYAVFGTAFTPGKSEDESSWLAYACTIGPRSNLPGNAPVCSFFRKTTWPLTMDASSPSDFCFSRRAPAGKS